MMSLKTAYDKLVKDVNAIQAIALVIYFKKLTMTQKLIKLKRKYLTMINTLPFKILIS